MSYYIIKTKDDEFVKVYASKDIYGEPCEFAEFVPNGRRWKPEQVEIVEQPTPHGQECLYKYLGMEIDGKVPEMRLTGIPAVLEIIDKTMDFYIKKQEENPEDEWIEGFLAGLLEAKMAVNEVERKEHAQKK